MAREPGPEECDEAEEDDPFFEDFVDRAPPRNREAKTRLGESLGNQGLGQAQQKGLVQVVQAK